MWTIIKFKKENLNLLKEDLFKKLGTSPKIYIPKLKLQYIKKKKHFEKYFFILGDYLFCFHESFHNMEVITTLKYCKGLKYFINGFKDSQKEIQNFIFQCNKHENEDGYLKQSFFEFCTAKNFKFISGPFTDMIFKIVNVQKDKLKVLIGDIFATIKDKKNYLYRPI